MLTSRLVERILNTIPSRSVGLLGDLFLDRYLDIDPGLDEPSIETGKTAFQVTRVRSFPGALGTVLNNLAALGVGTIRPVTLIGDDGEGYELQQALRAIPVVKMDGVLVASDRRTPTYTKPMYGPEELNRLDIKNQMATPKDHVERIIAKVEELWDHVDAWIVLDQVGEADCGVVTAAVRERLADLSARDSGKFVLADSRGRIGLFRNVWTKPNVAEAFDAYDRFSGQLVDRANDGAVAEWLRELTGRPVFCTCGEYGILLARSGAEPVSIRTPRVTGRIDVCGAGDSCSAGITCAMLAGATPEQSAAFGNLVASITIQQIGVTGTATPGQVRARLKEMG